MAESSFPRAGLARDGFTREGEATATCFCGGIQIAFPREKPGLIDTFICHCHDCRKITASMFASNFIVDDKYRRFIRGHELLKEFGQADTIETGNRMTNHFCSDCGTLMFRVSSGFPGHSIMRIGTVDDFSLHDTKLKPRMETYANNRVSWLHAAQGIEQIPGLYYGRPKDTTHVSSKEGSPDGRL